MGIRPPEIPDTAGKADAGTTNARAAAGYSCSPAEFQIAQIISIHNQSSSDSEVDDDDQSGMARPAKDAAITDANAGATGVRTGAG